ncbi:MAG: hypothetical protein ACRYF3_14280 [Janthinobacterium lividum]
MPVLSHPEYHVLNAVALRKMLAMTALPDAMPEVTDPTGTVGGLVASGLIVDAGGYLLPTDDAAPVLAETAAQLYADVRTDGAVLDLLDRFETTNKSLLTTMSDWQQVTVAGRKVTNDHSDAAYDGRIIDKIDKLVSRLDALLGALGAHDDHFLAYRERFASALHDVDTGDIDMVSSPTRESVHTIWFEFHEDLLRVLGRARTE